MKNPEDAAWGGATRRKLGLARGALVSALEALSESPDWTGLKLALQEALDATVQEQVEPCAHAVLVECAAELSEVWGTEDQALLYAKAGAVVAAVNDLQEAAEHNAWLSSIDDGSDPVEPVGGGS